MIVSLPIIPSLSLPDPWFFADEVERVQRPSKPTKKVVEHDDEEEEDATSPEDDVDVKEEEEEDVEPLPKKKRKAKKAVPVGSNGLKKKRVMKSRMHIDEKGFMGKLGLI